MQRAGSRVLSSLSKQSPLQVTTLPSGVKVATESTPGHFSAVGVYVNAGSRYESQKTLGASHLLDRMSYSASTNRTSEQFAAETAALGGQFQSISSRETMIYQASTYSHSIPQTLSLLTDTALNPLILADELERQKMAARWESAQIHSKPDTILPELLHEVAYRDNTLGNPLLCPDDRFDVITPELLKAYHTMWYRPDRIVIAAAGVAHDAFVDMVAKQLDAYKLTSTPKSKNSVLDLLEQNKEDSFDYLANLPARYTGGACYIEDDTYDFTHLFVGYESFSVNDLDSIYALATLQTLLGGGGSFSAGGPGKGMYSRLYTQVLNQHHMVDFCSSFHHTYQDSGLFGIYISVTHQYANRAAKIIAQQMDSCCRAGLSAFRSGISQQDLSRAKNQLKSSLTMALESRVMQVEDLARQVQAHGFKTSAEDMCKEIDKVTMEDVRRVANAVFRPDGQSGRSGEPTILARGQCQGLGDVRACLDGYGLTP